MFDVQHRDAWLPLKAWVMGLGDVYVYGHPAQVVVRGSGSGDVYLMP